MNSIKIVFDPDYPTQIVNSFKKIHELQTQRSFEILIWDNEIINQIRLKEAIFLLFDYKNRGMDETIIKHFEEGYRIIVCKAYKMDDFFELAMTLLRVWPFIIEKKNELESPFCYTFNYGGRRLKKKFG